MPVRVRVRVRKLSNAALTEPRQTHRQTRWKAKLWALSEKRGDHQSRIWKDEKLLKMQHERSD